MTPDPATVRALAEEFTIEDLRDLRKAALKVRMEGGTVSRSYEGSSFSISLENCAQIIAETTAAIDAKRISADGDDPVLTQTPMGAGVDFSRRRIE
jgi:hypothetical protein